MNLAVCESATRANSDLDLIPGRNLVTGENDLAAQIGYLTTLEADLLTLASAVFAADLAVRRGEREAITRTITLSVPVVNLHAFKQVTDDLTYVLYLLSRDNWNLDFIARPGQPESAMPRRPGAGSGKTLLFSGGLDSLAAAVEALESGGQLQLVSHFTGNAVTKRTQEFLADYLQQRFASQCHRVAVRTGGRTIGSLAFPKDNEREPTQRTRSFLFLVLAAICARHQGQSEIVMIAENGQMAIHLPLTAARIGAFSTHTAHPEYVKEIESMLSLILNFPFSITNPFLYRTKAECVVSLIPNHINAVERSTSCWKSSRQSSNHCGECIPCFVRRISLEANGVVISEYARDLFAEHISALPSDDAGKRNFVDLAEFVSIWQSGRSNAELESRYPELINPSIDRGHALSMYRRFASEAMLVFANYPGPTSVLI